MPTKTTVDETITRETLHGPVTGHPIIKENIHRITTKESVAPVVVPPANPPTSEPPLLPMATPPASETPPASNTRQERTESTTRVETRTKKSWPWGWIIGTTLGIFISIFLLVSLSRRSPPAETAAAVAARKAPAEDSNKAVLDRIDSVAKESKTNTEESIKNAFKGVKSEIETAKTEITKSIPKPEEIKKIVSTEIEARTRPVYDRMANLEKKQEEFEKKLAAAPAPQQPPPSQPQQHTLTIKVEPPQQVASQPPPAQVVTIQPQPTQPPSVTVVTPPAQPTVIVPNPPPPQPNATTYPVVTQGPKGWRKTITLGVNQPSKKYSVLDIKTYQVGWHEDRGLQSTVTVRLWLNKRHTFAKREFLDVDFPITKEKLQNVDHVVFIPRERPFEIYEK